MSSRLRLRSHGVYVNAKPDCSSENTRLEALKCKEFALGDNATPTSPIAPDLASGVIRRKGTAVNKVLEMHSPLLSMTQPFAGSNTCPNMGIVKSKITVGKSCFILNIIFSFLKNCAKLTITINYIQKITF